MKCSDIMLSVLLHAGLVGGVICGLSDGEDVFPDEDAVHPIFFEILEECAAAETQDSSTPDSAVKDDSAGETVIPDASAEDNSVVTADAAELSAEIALENVAESDGKSSGADVEPSMVTAEKEIKAEKISPVKMMATESVQATANPDSSVDIASESEMPPQREAVKAVSAPMPIGTISPTYPRSARRRGQEGSVTLEISVNDAGEVTDAKVLAGSGYDCLDNAALSAVRSASFTPAIEEGVRVQGRIKLNFDFKLR